MKTILVTGASGFVGRHLLQALVKEKCNIVATNYSGSASFASKNILWEKCDLREIVQIHKLISEYQFDEVYHLAGKAITTDSKSFDYYQINTIGTVNLLSKLPEFGFKGKILIVSSSSVYGNGNGLPITENTLLNPLNDYAGSKAAMEMAALSFINRGLNIVVTRSFNHTGPYQEDYYVCSDFARQFAQIMLGKRDLQLKVGNVDIFRDFSDVRDIVGSYKKLMRNSDTNGIYNICSERAISIREIINTLKEISNIDVQIVTEQKRIRKNETNIIVGDASKLKKCMCWENKYSIRQTLEDLLQYWVEKESKILKN